MTRYLDNQRTTRRVVASLQQAGLLTTWSLKAVIEGQEHAVTGIWKIDEPALKALPLEQLDPLRQNGALAIVYAQLWSQSRMQKLQQVASAHAAADDKQRALDEQMKDLFSDDGGELRFDF